MSAFNAFILVLDTQENTVSIGTDHPIGIAKLTCFRDRPIGEYTIEDLHTAAQIKPGYAKYEEYPKEFYEENNDRFQVLAEYEHEYPTD